MDKRRRPFLLIYGTRRGAAAYRSLGRLVEPVVDISSSDSINHPHPLDEDSACVFLTTTRLFTSSLLCLFIFVACSISYEAGQNTSHLHTPWHDRKLAHGLKYSHIIFVSQWKDQRLSIYYAFARAQCHRWSIACYFTAMRVRTCWSGSFPGNSNNELHVV